MSNIFLSYAREDLERARRLAEALEAQGWSVFWDQYIPPGKTWQDVIGTALHQAVCVIVAWSEVSIHKDWVREEAEEGKARKLLVPVLFDKVMPPMGFRSIQAASLVGWEGDPSALAFRQLVSAVGEILGQPKQLSEPPPASPRQPEIPVFEVRQEKAKAESGVSPPPSAEAAVGRKPGTVFRDTLWDGTQGPEMVVIPAGEFRMGDIQGSGDRNEQPVHSVRIPRPFAMGRYTVTFDEYDDFARATGQPLRRDNGWGRGRRPVIYVSWNDAVTYAQWLFKQTGKRYRLPTEAEWEYAARAGTETAYWWGNQKEKNRANYTMPWQIFSGKTMSVASFQPNPWGLYETAGNVYEWVRDCWHENYAGAPEDGGKPWEAEGGGDCDKRVIRGGSWIYDPGGVRSATRGGGTPSSRSNDVGFRLAQDL